LLFFVRGNLIVSFLGFNRGLKQAQRTSMVVLMILLPITYLVLRYSKPVPDGEIAATYGIPQTVTVEKKVGDEKQPAKESETTASEIGDQKLVIEEAFRNKDT
jgi:phosphatidylglycerol:prolipoprotein diacylglycerol transferase